MVECTLNLDSVFGSLSDPTRRDILRRVARHEHSVGEIAKHYPLTFAAISKHLKVLEKAKLITKRKEGKEHIVQISPLALKEADDYLESYRRLWEKRFDSLEKLLKEMEE
jgi:DNA-binding transcriptional ArsR family regulator